MLLPVPKKHFELATCNYIGDCRNFYSTKYIRLPELLLDLAVARAEGTYRKVMSQYKKYRLLIIDEWLLVALSEPESRDLLEIIEARHKKASTIFGSQFAPAGWHQKIGQETLADAILDRIVHDSYTIVIDGKDGGGSSGPSLLIQFRHRSLLYCE